MNAKNHVCLLVIQELRTNNGVCKVAGIYTHADIYHDIRDAINSFSDVLSVRVCPSIKVAKMYAKAEDCRYIGPPQQY